MEDQIVDIGEYAYIVESEKIKDKWYTCNMHTGYCSCLVGSTCAPCKHKSAVAKYTGKANFTKYVMNLKMLVFYFCCKIKDI